jgi:hypothetical protein
VQHAPFLLLIFSVFALPSTFFLMVVVVMFHQDESNLAVAARNGEKKTNNTALDYGEKKLWK